MHKTIFLLTLFKITICITSFPLDMTTKQVLLGSTVSLKCLSNGNNFNFLLWQPADSSNGLVGPSNNYSKFKYNYEILSGQLIIKEVSFEDDGVYNCISKGVLNEKINISAIKLDVLDDFTGDSLVGYYIYRVVFFIGTIMLVLQIVFIVYYKNFKTENENDRLDYLECLNDEEDLMTTIDLSANQRKEIRKEENCVISEENE